MAFLGFILYFLFTRTLGLLPLGLVFRIGALLGRTVYLVAGPYRRLVLSNLQLAYAGEKDDRELRAIAREHFRLLGANVLASVKSAMMHPDALAKHVEWEGLDNVLHFLTAGHGVVGIINHMSNWEMLAMMPHLYPQLKYATVYQRLGNRWIDEDVKRMRARHGVKPFDRRDGFAAPIQFVRDGGVLAILADQHAGDGGVWAPFFGRLASTSPLAATVAKRANVPIVPMGIYTIGPARWKFVMGQPIPAGDGEPEELTAEINAAIERQVRRAPADWFWVHNRWKLPRPFFLLSNYHRGVALPSGFDSATLKPFRILIRSTNWLGDAVMTVPAVRAIKAGRPDAHVTILTRSKNAEFWKRVEEVDDVIAIEAKESVFRVARKIRGKFEVAILLPNSLRTALEVWLAGIPRRVGYAGHRRRMLLNEVVERDEKPGPPVHQANDYLNLAEFVGAHTGDKVTLDAPLRFVERAQRKPRIGICPGAEYGSAKRWPAPRFAEVARTVASKRRDCEWALFGLEADRESGLQIWNALNRQCDNRIGKTGLPELMDELTQCDVLLTNDTGTMHLAAFLGVKVVAIFGSTEPALTGPLGEGHAVIRRHVECSPCFLRECPIDFRCMNEIDTDQVVAAVLDALPAE